MAQQQADALALLAEAALDHGLDPGAPGERYQVVVHVDAAALADPDQPGQSVLEDGARVSAETSRRLACDASRVVMRHDEDGRTLEVGARTRTIPPALRRALHHRDQGCRFPGCGLPFGQGHHVRHWAQGGPTTLSNLALLCRRHHRAVHEEGYQVDRQPDGALQFRRPDGRPLPGGPATGRGARRSSPGAAGAARRAGTPPPRADDLPVLAGGAPGSWATRSPSCIPSATRLPGSSQGEGKPPSTVIASEPRDQAQRRRATLVSRMSSYVSDATLADHLTPRHGARVATQTPPYISESRETASGVASEAQVISCSASRCITAVNESVLCRFT